MVSQSRVCDYTGYDYKVKYWSDGFRDYEHRCESDLLTRLLAQLSLPGPSSVSLLDAGCGFGRLFPSYHHVSRDIVLLDYSNDMLEAAKQELGRFGDHHIRFVQGELGAIPLGDGCVDVVVSIRTLHHLSQPSQFYDEAFRVLSPGGHLIVEIPNKRNLMRILRFLFKPGSPNPFTSSSLKLGDCFYNFHITSQLNSILGSGFSVVRTRNTNYFRVPILKKFFPTSFLVGMDRLFQIIFPFRLTPSVFVVCKKT